MTLKLVRRIKPLSIAEAEVSIAALDLDDRLKSRQYEVLIPLYLEQGRIQEAMALYDQIPGGRRRRANMRSRLIQECEARGRSEEAIPLYQEILELDPDNRAARAALDRLRQGH
jgi:tetratricopeptide (TPR) repeat protein